MSSRNIATLTALILTLMLFLPIKSYSQIIAPSGNPSKAASQLIYYYDRSCNRDFELVDGTFDCIGGEQDSSIQVTNTNDTAGVTIHVQVFRSFDTQPGDTDSAPVICDERNFVDFLTPNDTHVYDLDLDEFFKNEGENETTVGEETALDLDETKGFVIITPVVSEADLTAIAFEHLIGNTADNGKDNNDPEIQFRLNAMGRSAVDFTTGEVVTDGTPLDGVTNGFVLIQPEELLFDFGEDNDDGGDGITDGVNIVGIAFSDSYGPPGLLGYQVNPSNTIWTSFVFDYKEDPTSCGIRPINCFDTMGLTDNVEQINEFLDQDAGGNDRLCAGVELPETPTGDFGREFDFIGWTRIFVSGLGDFTNHLGVHIAEDNDGAKWFNSNKEEIASRAIKRPTGESTRASTQLIYYYDQTKDGDEEGDDTGDTTIHLTNTNDTTAVTVHVQIFRSFDPGDEPDVDPVLCDERDFIDVLTPNDTHVYELDDDNFPKNVGETETDPGESTSIDVRDTKGFVIITPVVSEADLTAISFQHLIGSSTDDNAEFWMNAVGRDAVDLTTGEILADGTPLNGVTTGFYVIQPEELLVDFAVAGDVTDAFGADDEADVVAIAFDDSYGPAGLLGYNITPATATWNTFIYDFKEDPTSCGTRTVNCFLTVGLNDTIVQNNIELNSISIPDNDITPGDLLCAGTETPEYPDSGNGDIELDHFGWLRVFVSGLGENTNHLGFFVVNDFADDEPGLNLEGADLMYAKGEEVIPDLEPPAEDCAVEGDEDEDGFADCLDTDCATAEECETGEEECADTMDNDEDGDTDCADLGCDGTIIDSESGVVCETGGETSCNDGFDNDGDGAVDGNDTDCQAADTGGTGGDGDGGGCVVTGTVSTSSSVVNILVLMLPFIGVFGIRRIRKRN